MSATPALRPGSRQACALPRVARPSATVYRPRRPEKTVVYQLVQEHLETWRARVREADPDSGPIPRFAERDLRKYLDGGILARAFARARCGGCRHRVLIAYSCKGRGVCPACNTRHMADTAAHLVDQVSPQVPVRQWVLSFPKRLRYFLQHDPALTTPPNHRPARPTKHSPLQTRVESPILRTPSTVTVPLTQQHRSPNLAL